MVSPPFVLVDKMSCLCFNSTEKNSEKIDDIGPFATRHRAIRGDVGLTGQHAWPAMTKIEKGLTGFVGVLEI